MVEPVDERTSWTPVDVGGLDVDVMWRSDGRRRDRCLNVGLDVSRVVARRVAHDCSG